MALKTKTRVNSRINNKRGGKGKKGKKINSFLTKIQGNKSVSPEKSYGYCFLHNINVGKEKYEFKGCINCEHFLKRKKEMIQMWILTQDKQAIVKVEEIKLRQGTDWGNPSLTLIQGISKAGFTYELGYYETPERTQKEFQLIIDAITSGDTYYEMPAYNKKDNGSN